LKFFAQHFLFARVAQHVGRMDRSERLGPPVVVETAANLEHAFLKAQQSLDGRSSQAADEPRPDCLNLTEEKRRAALDFVPLRSAVAGRAAFYHVADVDVLALDADRLEHSVQELACRPDKRDSLLIFIGAGPFADENKVRVRAPLTKHDRL